MRVFPCICFEVALSSFASSAMFGAVLALLSVVSWPLKALGALSTVEKFMLTVLVMLVSVAVGMSWFLSKMFAVLRSVEWACWGNSQKSNFIERRLMDAKVRPRESRRQMVEAVTEWNQSIDMQWLQRHLEDMRQVLILSTCAHAQWYEQYWSGRLY